MNIDFKRNRTQVEYEKLVGIRSVEELELMRGAFKNYILTESDAAKLRTENEKDAVSYLLNALISMSEGFDNMIMRRYTWATIELYYSIFYFLRASMAINNIAMLRNKSMFRLKLSKGEKVYSTGNKKYNSTHGGTIAHYRDVFAGTDILLTNRIDDMDPYEWFEEVRNIVNYRQVQFLDPSCLDIWSVFDDALDDGSINDLFNTILEDNNYIYCFQEDYAVVAFVLKRFQQTIMEFQNKHMLAKVDVDSIKYVDGIIPVELSSLDISNYINKCLDEVN